MLLFALSVPTWADTGTPATTLEACVLAAESQTCPECSSGDVTCTYGDTSVTAGSCGDCQARGALYQALCDAGITDSRDAIEAGTTCAPPACVVWIDTCTDPCLPLCLPEHLVPPTPPATSAAPIPPCPTPASARATGSAARFSDSARAI